MKVFPRPRLRVEQTTEFFVSMVVRSHLSGAAVFCAFVIGAAVLTRDDRPAIRAVLWEGLPTLSNNVAKPSTRTQEKRTRKRSSGGDVGNALRAAYNDALKEEIPPDLLALLGKLD